jgi:hypothetical protein
MRRIALLGCLLLPGCTGFGEFLNHTFSPPPINPNLPGSESETTRRILGRASQVEPLHPEEGNVWPGPEAPTPTLSDVAGDQSGESQRGFAPTVVPGAAPGLPAGRQPRPAPRGSSTPDFGAPTPSSPTSRTNIPPPPSSSVPGPGPQGPVVQTPRGPAVDASGGGNRGYRQLTTPQGPNVIMIPNGNGTSTLIRPDGSVDTVPTPR